MGSPEVVGFNTAWATWAWVPLVAVPLLAWVVAWGTGATKTWARRKLPATVPPKGVFGPVWFALYVLLGYSLTRVLQEGTETDFDWRHWLYIGLFGAALLLNLAWSPVFAQDARHALFLIVGLLLLLSCQLAVAADIDFVAALVLVPYLVWVAYATLMNHDVVLSH